MKASYQKIQIVPNNAGSSDCWGRRRGALCRSLVSLATYQRSSIASFWRFKMHLMNSRSCAQRWRTSRPQLPCSSNTDKHITGAGESSATPASNSGIDIGTDLSLNSAIKSTLISLRRVLDELKSQLPKPRAKGIGIKSRWILDKQGTMEIVSNIERQKSTLHLAMSELGL